MPRDEQTLSEFITYGFDDDEKTRIGRLPADHGVLGETIRVAQALRIDDLIQHHDSSGFPAHHPPMRCFLGVLVVTPHGHVWDDLYVTEPRNGYPFTRDDELLLGSFDRVSPRIVTRA